MNPSPLILLALLLVLTITSRTEADDSLWNNSPINYANNPINWDNSPLNYNNNPVNWENNPTNADSQRIIRDPSGGAIGYAVPKPDGGVNYFSMDGQRRAYSPPDE